MNISVNSSFVDVYSTICSNIFVAWTLTLVLLSPVLLFVLCVVSQQCWKARCHSSTTTHSDVFTFNMAAIETLGILNACIAVSDFYTHHHNLQKMVDSVGFLTTVGQTLLHILVCLERYFAVVHPIAYLRLKRNGAVIRNVSIAAVWLVSVAVACMCNFYSLFVNWFTIIVAGVLSLVLVSFFCASVLYVLIRPGPGDRTGNRSHVDQSKLRAFHTVAAITVALMLKFVSLFVLFMAYQSRKLDTRQICLLRVSVLWFHIPSSFVTPVLFLYRRVKQR